MTKHKMILYLLVLLLSPAARPAAAPADYRIENAKGNVYRFVNDRHRSVFLITGEGIILTDPHGMATGSTESRISFKAPAPLRLPGLAPAKPEKSEPAPAQLVLGRKHRGERQMFARLTNPYISGRHRCLFCCPA